MRAIRAIGIARPVWIAGTMAAAGTLTAAMLQGQVLQPSSPTLSPSNPADVAIPANFPENENPIEFFDDFSWQMFLTMVWPSDPARRGQPDLNRPLGAPGPLVFETFRGNWEVFQPGGAAPAKFDEDASVNPTCANVALPAGAFLLLGFTPYDEFRLAGFGPLAGPLPTQQRTYTRYATAYNRIQYDHITDTNNKLYLRASPHVPFPSGSVMVKSAWIEMTAGVQNPSRFYTRQAWVRDPVSGNCSEQKVGLVGLHIVKKTPTRPQWIWSTFEQVDTAPNQGATPDPTRPFIYNSNSGSPMSTAIQWPKSPSPPTSPANPAPGNIYRIKPIHNSTLTTNNRYQQALKAGNQVWQFYRLVMTQWPTTPNNPGGNGKPANTFPGTGSDSTAFANATMEPFVQSSISSGCMNCHNFTRPTDYIWAIEQHAWPPKTKLDTKAFRKLRELKSDVESR